VTTAIRGWETVRLRGSRIECEVVPGKGGDILGARWLPRGVDLLWRSPWGLRRRASVPTGATGPSAFLETYPGGWQTIFPNGGDPASLGGVEQPFHGEATLAPWEWTQVDDAAIEMTTRLTRSPFHLRKRVTVRSAGIEVEETILNEGRSPLDVMWSHHPAFGAPLLGPGCRIEAAATTFLADDARDTPAGDLRPGATSEWPHAVARGSGTVDLRLMPDEATPRDRFGYLLGFTEPRMALVNQALGLQVTLRWDLEVMPCAWYWLEAHATLGYPWYGAAYVLGLEPASSYPGQGLDAVRAKHGPLLRFAPGEERTAHVSLEVEELAASG